MFYKGDASRKSNSRVLTLPSVRVRARVLWSALLEFISTARYNVEWLFNFLRGHQDIANRRASQRRCVATELPCVNQVLESSRDEQSSRGTSGEPWRLLRLHLRGNAVTAAGSKPAEAPVPLSSCFHSLVLFPPSPSFFSLFFSLSPFLSYTIIVLTRYWILKTKCSLINIISDKNTSGSF